MPPAADDMRKDEVLVPVAKSTTVTKTSVSIQRRQSSDIPSVAAKENPLPLEGIAAIPSATSAIIATNVPNAVNARRVSSGSAPLETETSVLVTKSPVVAKGSPSVAGSVVLSNGSSEPAAAKIVPVAPLRKESVGKRLSLDLESAMQTDSTKADAIKRQSLPLIAPARSTSIKTNNGSDGNTTFVAISPEASGLEQSKSPTPLPPLPPVNISAPTSRTNELARGASGDGEGASGDGSDPAGPTRRFRSKRMQPRSTADEGGEDGISGVAVSNGADDGDASSKLVRFRQRTSVYQYEVPPREEWAHDYWTGDPEDEARATAVDEDPAEDDEDGSDDEEASRKRHEAFMRIFGGAHETEEPSEETKAAR
ncbi:hypothetical protein HK405_004023 [Cladochytrium tenue]|nr:hypothetical protein HK405_004023 [Cladochytrium tenue]